jgi:gliding motility-associated-like protein
MRKNLLFIFFVLPVLTAAICHAQAPNIHYSGPQTFTTGMAIGTMIPVNTGGSVPATVYGQVSTFAGTAGVHGAVNGTGAAASFWFPTALAADASGNLYVADGFNYLVRKITPAGVVTTFAGTGVSPAFYNLNGITVDASGNVYVSDAGNETIRKITPAGAVSTFAGKMNAAGAANGPDTTASFYGPLGLAIDKNGNIYVADNSNYLIRRITPAGLVSTYAGRVGINGAVNGPDTVATFNPQGCAVDKNGNVYIGDGNNHLIRKITPLGVVSTFAGSGAVGSSDGTGTSASFNQLGPLTVDAAGNLFVADGVNGTIRKITPTRVVTTLAGTAGAVGSSDGVGSAATFNGPAGITIDKSGNLFVTDIINNTIRKIVTTGFAIDKPLPAGLTFDPQTGNISGTPTVFSPATDYAITAYNKSGSSTAIINIAVTGTLSFAPISPKTYGTADFNPAMSTSGPVTYTSSSTFVATVVAGKIHTVGVGTSSITATNGSTAITQLLSVNQAPLTVIADNKSKAYNAANPPLTITYGGFVNGDSNANLTSQPAASTVALTTTLPGSYPINVSGAADSNYTFNYVAGTLTILGGKTTTAAPEIQYASQQPYTSGSAITPVSPVNTGGIVPATVYGTVSTMAVKAGITGSSDGNGTAASFNQPGGIAIDANGNLYITDELNNLIRKITPAGLVSTIAGSGTAGAVNATGTAASFNFPVGITCDATSNLYVTEAGNSLVRKITPQKVVTTFAGGGSSLNGTRLQSSFLGPNGITVDNNGNFFIVDEFNELIRKITPAGAVTTFAGVYQSTGSANGQGSVATFNQSQGIAVDATGNLYVADGGNYLVRKITPNGFVSTLAGSGMPGSYDGTGTGASFNFFTGITVDGVGNVYVADGGNNIRKITPGGVVTTIAGAINVPGTNTTTYGYVDAIGTSARFSAPSGLVFDISGNLYITDTGNQLIRKMITTGFSIDKPLPAGLTFDPTTGIISGTPTVASPATLYTISAYNVGGGSSAVISLSVAPSQNASLSALTLSSGLISPVFAATKTTYTASVPNSATSITITPTVTGPGATIMVNGTSVVSGTASGSIPLSVGNNIITTTITAQDGTTTQTYTVTVARAPSSNAFLSGLKISSSNISPAFSQTNTGYTASVLHNITSVTVTPTTNDANATITVNGISVLSGIASAPVALNTGPNTITTIVTAQDGTTTDTYTVTATRALSSNANLALIHLSSGTLSPAFAAATTSYTASVSNATASIAVTPTAVYSTTTITVNGTAVNSGTASAAIPLSVGSNTITLIGTAQDGVTTKTYTVTVTRALSTNAKLALIHLSSGTLSPVFAAATTSYTASVTNATTSITVTPTAVDATATVTVNGIAVTSGTVSGSIALAQGANTITLVGTAQDGVTNMTYTVTVTRALSTNAKLALIHLSSGTLSPVFASATTGYTASVTNATNSITVTPTVVDATATVTVNGTAVTSGTASGSIALAQGANTIALIGTAQDGVTNMTYTVTVTRATGPVPIATPQNFVENTINTPQIDGIIVHQGVSPNGDGANDFLTIDGITNYPDNKLMIMNRSGELVFEAKGYDNSSKVFDGHSNKNGKKQQPGTYFYSLEYKSDGITKYKTGFIILKW